MGLLGQFPAEADGPRTAIGVIGVSPKDGVRRIWVDPYRGVAQGTTPFVTPGYLLSQFHAYLMIPTWGYAIVCSLVFFLLASLITGLADLPEILARILPTATRDEPANVDGRSAPARRHLVDLVSRHPDCHEPLVFLDLRRRTAAALSSCC